MGEREGAALALEAGAARGARRAGRSAGCLERGARAAGASLSAGADRDRVEGAQGGRQERGERGLVLAQDWRSLRAPLAPPDAAVRARGPLRRRDRSLRRVGRGGKRATHHRGGQRVVKISVEPTEGYSF